MTKPIRLWTCSTHHTAFRCGGWASVRSLDGQLTGAAGGERNTTAARMALAGLAAGLADLPTLKAGQPPQTITLETNSPVLAAFSTILATLAATSDNAPEADLDLWARIITGAKGRRLALTLVPMKPETAIAFVAAWADLAMDRGKTRGAFAMAIPRINLARMPG
jgi:ribonuclease HI